MELQLRSLRRWAVAVLPSLMFALGVQPGLAQVPAMPPGGAPPSYAQAMVLNEAQMQGFIGAMKEFQVLNAKLDGKQPGKINAYLQGMEANAETQAILSKHGFADLEQFKRVAYNASMAHGVLKQGGKEKVKKELDDSARQQAAAMEQMKKHLSPEQLKAMQGQTAAGMAIAGSMADVPDENLALAKKYSAEMDALSKK